MTSYWFDTQYHYPTASPIDIISAGVGWSTKAWIYLRASQASLVPALGELMKDVDDNSIPQTIGTYSWCGCAGGDINLNDIGIKRCWWWIHVDLFDPNRHSLLLFFMYALYTDVVCRWYYHMPSQCWSPSLSFISKPWLASPVVIDVRWIARILQVSLAAASETVVTLSFFLGVVGIKTCSRDVVELRRMLEDSVLFKSVYSEETDMLWNNPVYSCVSSACMCVSTNNQSQS